MLAKRTSPYLTLVAVAFFGFFLVFSSVLAQAVSDSDITVSVSPQIPGPLTDVTITLSSLSVDLNVADIAWTAGGSTVLTGLGRKNYSFKTGTVGTTTTIEATIDVRGTPTITKRITITPLEVDLLWEAVDSYVPPFYKGKALFSSEGTIKVVAIPNIRSISGTRLTPGDFTYNWKRNYTSEPLQSGYAKNTFLFRHSYLNPEEKIDVSIANPKGGEQASKSIAVSATTPRLFFYSSDPEQGIEYNKTIDTNNYVLVGNNGLVLVAEPYFFSSKTLASGDLSFSWSVNDRPEVSSGAKNTFSILPENTGLAKLKLEVSNKAKLFQSGSKTINLNLQADE